MDTPICVFDAQTFVDHVHEIKAWFYGGHLRLVVPISTSEIVEQLYKKSIEPKPTTQDPPRPKSASKAARKVNPAFDINPSVAREFLARLRKGKEEEHEDREKSLCYEDEKWAAIQFQTSKEEYTPWKDVPVEEPKIAAPDDRPLSWAELARKKLQANGGNEMGQGLKSSAKPKLVSKASGHDPSPWKMQNNLPKIPATEISALLRPLMSCALWHLHESINRNDLNQLFLLTDQEEIQIVAKKLNITARSRKEVDQKIAESIKKSDLNVEGMLEKEGLIKPKEGAQSVAVEALGGENGSRKPSHVSLSSHELQPDHGQVEENGHADLEIGSSKLEIRASQLAPSNGVLQPEKTPEATRVEKVPGDSSNDAAKVVIDPRQLVQSILNKPSAQAQNRYATEETKVEEIKPKEQAARNREESIEIIPDQKKPDWTKVDQLLPTKEPSKSPDHRADPPLSVAQDDLDDSDEEVVVFVPNPKRMSTQKRVVASSSRPTTAHGHPVVPPKTDGPEPAALKGALAHRTAGNGTSKVQVTPQTRQRPLSSGPGVYDPEQGPKKVKAVPHGHPRPLSSGPTVIDPNAFGRGLTATSTPGVLANVGASKRSRQHSPRTSMQGPTLNASSSAQSSPQTSPARHKAGRSPRRSPRATPQKMEDPPPTTVPIISHQAFTRAPLVAPNAQKLQNPRFGPIEPPSKSSSNLDSSAAAADANINGEQNLRQAPIQRPRSANGPSQTHGHNANFSRRRSPRSHPPNGSTPPATGGQQSQRTLKKSLFEPDLDRTGAQPTTEPETKDIKMPEVQYTLKSGMTREAARGKGKLWVG